MSLPEDAGTPAFSSRLSPLELAAKPAVRFPEDVAVLTGIPESTLRALKRDGDAPRLFYIGRASFSTIDEVRDWILAHEVAEGHLARPAVVPRSRRKS
ncbi:MAG: hypothetical protein AB7G13_22365 [Lautropia sp.]